MSRIARPIRSIVRDPRPHRSRAALVGVVLVSVTLGGCAVFAGLDAVASAAVGLVLVAAFFLIGRLPILIEKQIGGGAAFLFLGLNYLFRIVLLLVALLALQQQSWVEPNVTGLVVIVGALGWNVLELLRHLAIGRAENADDGAGKPEAITVGPAREVNADV